MLRSLRRRLPSLEASEWAVVVPACVAAMGAVYTTSLPTFALPQWQAGLQLSYAEAERVLYLSRLGALPSLLLMIGADWLGRRRLLLLSTLGLALGALGSGFARSVDQLIAAQFATTACRIALEMLTAVVVVEELRAQHRGWATALFRTLSFGGGGLALLAFACIEWLPYGWRSVFALGGFPLLLLPWLATRLRETQRFEAHRRTRGPLRGSRVALQPLRDLLSAYPGRLAALLVTMLVVAATTGPAGAMVSRYLQGDRGYGPPGVALVIVASGFITPLVTLASGGFSDRFGRKRMLVLSCLLEAASGILFYQSDGLWTLLALGLFFAAGTAVNTMFVALGAELFPTSHRSTAAGLREITQTLSYSLGIWVMSGLHAQSGSLGSALSWMLLAAPVACLVAALGLPETGGRTLEEIAPEAA